MSLEATIKRIERKVDELSKPKPKWVPAFVITELTGWDGGKMRTAREHNLITWKDEGGKYLYDLNTLHTHFLKSQKQTA